MVKEIEIPLIPPYGVKLERAQRELDVVSWSDRAPARRCAC